MACELVSDDALPAVPMVPAPWDLTGTGYIVSFRFSDHFVEAASFLPPSFRERRHRNFGTMMFVDYATSNAGPYRELLFVPARFQVDGGWYWTITRIFVSTWESVVNGRRNWGIPKDRADFVVVYDDDGVDRITVSAEGRPFARLAFETGGPSVPVCGALAPSSLRTLVQERNGKRYIYKPFANGQLKRARLVEAEIDPAVFPDVTQGRTVAAVQVPRFTMTFPESAITPL